MSIEIDILNGSASWAKVKPLFDLVWTPEVLARSGDVDWANPDLRVLIENENRQIISHVGLYFRDGLWNGRKARLAGVGGVTTHPDHRRKGYASVALDAAIQTIRHHEAIDFVLLVCDDEKMSFYAARKWQPFGGVLIVEQNGQQVKFDVMKPMIFDMAMRPRTGTIDLCGLPW